MAAGQGQEGWNWIINSRKWHYFQADGRALCGRYAILGDNADAEQGGEGSPDNCRECVRRLSKRPTATSVET